MPRRILATHSDRGHIWTGQEWLPAQLLSSEAGRHLQCPDQLHLSGDKPDHFVEDSFVPWIKGAWQPLAQFRSGAWVLLLRYRFAGLCCRMFGVARDENAVLI
jgi:hypothetical protein